MLKKTFALLKCQQLKANSVITVIFVLKKNLKTEPNEISKKKRCSKKNKKSLLDF